MRIFKLTIAAVSMLLIAAAVPRVTGSSPTKAQAANREGLFWDPRYNNGVQRERWAQHLGVDLKASTSDDVFSPVDGYVIVNNTNDADVTQGTAFVVIKDISTGWEHVLGHIKSPWPTCPVSRFPKRCPENTRVSAAKSVIGKPLPKQEFGVHVHWGVNTISVSMAMGVFRGPKWKGASGQKWGWGRAPYEAELPMACGLGWINPINYNKCG